MPLWQFNRHLSTYNEGVFMQLQPTEINNFLGVTGSDFVRRTQQLQDALIQGLDPTEKIEFPIKHYFAHGTYVREMHAPAGSLIVGKMHKHDHICIMLQGRAIVYNEHGQEEITAPYTFISHQGVKRIFIVLEDMIFQNVHPANTTDLEQLEKDLIVDESDPNAVKVFRTLLGLED